MSTKIFVLCGIVFTALALTFLLANSQSSLRFLRNGQAFNGDLESLFDYNPLASYGRNSLLGLNNGDALTYLLLQGQGQAQAQNQNLAQLALLGGQNGDLEETYTNWAVGGAPLCKKNCDLVNLLCPVAVEVNCLKSLNVLLIAANGNKCKDYANSQCQAKKNYCVANCDSITSLLSINGTAPTGGSSAPSTNSTAKASKVGNH